VDMEGKVKQEKVLHFNTCMYTFLEFLVNFYAVVNQKML